jgi:hypothetical protein
MTSQHIDEYAGLCRELEIGVRIAPTRASAPAVAHRLAEVLRDRPDVSMRLCSVEAAGTRVHFTVAVCLGTIDQIKTAEARSCAGVRFVDDVVRAFASHDAALVSLPVSAVRREPPAEAERVPMTPIRRERVLAAVG